jgi:hypothetical protein
MLADQRVERMRDFLLRRLIGGIGPRSPAASTLECGEVAPTAARLGPGHLP